MWRIRDEGSRPCIGEIWGWQGDAAPGQRSIPLEYARTARPRPEDGTQPASAPQFLAPRALPQLDACMISSSISSLNNYGENIFFNTEKPWFFRFSWKVCLYVMKYTYRSKSRIAGRLSSLIVGKRRHIHVMSFGNNLYQIFLLF